MEFDFSQIKTEFDEGRSGPTLEGETAPSFRDPHILPCDVLKGHWLEGGADEEADPAQDSAAEDSTYEINLNSLTDLEASQPPESEGTEETEMERPVGETVYHCPSCTYTVDKLWKLRNHQKIHIGAVYRCSYCDFQTNVKRNLARHELNHAPTKRFVCDECEYQNNSRVLFNKHKRSHSQHFKNSKFKCPICDFGSAERDSWKRHVLSHERLRLHECRRCDYVTTKLSDIKRHNLTHAKSDVSVFTGVQCSKAQCGKCNTTTTTTTTPSITAITTHVHHPRSDGDTHHHHQHHPEPLKPPLHQQQPQQQQQQHNHHHHHQQQQQQRFRCNRCVFESHDHSAFLAHTLTHDGSKSGVVCTSGCDCKTNFKNRLKEAPPQSLQKPHDDRVVGSGGEGLPDSSNCDFEQAKYKLDPHRSLAIECHQNS